MGSKKDEDQRGQSFEEIKEAPSKAKSAPAQTKEKRQEKGCLKEEAPQTKGTRQQIEEAKDQKITDMEAQSDQHSFLAGLRPQKMPSD